MSAVVDLHGHAFLDQGPSTEGVFPASSELFFDVWERPLAFKGKNAYYDVDSHKAIVRTINDKPKVIGVVGKDYNLIKTEEICKAAESEFLTAMTQEQLAGVTVRDRTAYFGRVCIRDYQFPAINVEIDGRGSVAKFRTIVTNGYDGSTSIKIYSGAIDAFCINGMVSGVFELTVKRHTRGVQVEHLAEHIGKNIKIFYTEAERWKSWVRKEITLEDAEKVFAAMPGASERLVAKLLRQFAIECTSRGRNVWALYSAATYYATYNEGEFATRGTENDHAAATMLNRELQVRRWTDTQEFLKLAA